MTRMRRFSFWQEKIEARTKAYMRYAAGALEILTQPERKKPAE
jgi:hypothetical protein